MWFPIHHLPPVHAFTSTQMPLSYLFIYLFFHTYLLLPTLCQECLEARNSAKFKEVIVHGVNSVVQEVNIKEITNNTNIYKRITMLSAMK